MTKEYEYKPEAKRLFKNIMKDAQKSGLTFEVDDDEWTPHNYNNLEETYLDCTFQVSECIIHFSKDGDYVGSVQWTGINDDECVLTDWHTSLDKYIPTLDNFLTF
jgi:hypothetical protein